MEHWDIRRGIDVRMCSEVLHTERAEPNISIHDLRSDDQERVYFVDGGFKLTTESNWKFFILHKDEKSYCRINNGDNECCAIASPTTEPGNWLVAAVTNHAFVLRKVGEVFATIRRAYLRSRHRLEKLVAFRVR